MRYKSWPYYDSWCEVFGKDRVVGTGAEDFHNALNGILHTESHPKSPHDTHLDDNDMSYTSLVDDGATTSVCQAGSSTTTKARSSTTTKFKQKPNGCKAFDWIELEVCDKGMEIGVTLLTRIEEKDDKIKLVEAINQELKSNNEKLHHVTYSLTTTNNALLHKMQEMDVKLKHYKMEGTCAMHLAGC
ncbi:hypothetical protein BUALT_Bualt18G0037400 [Buddleja alternifolia]|uniref:Uncharacterized protein n=1 Tax=Buddleja alternifolia TaxID=168488 RepID=A0AAV6WCZ3_9LAMI|nr:hypothetical protein BUALT_Bualt18G0037400 [Buddleja alternifolia]